MLTRKQFLRSALDLAAATLGLTVLQACGTSPHPTPLPDATDPGRARDGAASGPDPDAGSGSGSGTDGGPSAGRCATNGTDVTIGDNHGHVMVVSKAEVAAAVMTTYHIQGTSDHDHTVVLTAADYQMLQQDHAIMTTSSYDADHSHSILVACA